MIPSDNKKQREEKHLRLDLQGTVIECSLQIYRESVPAMVIVQPTQETLETYLQHIETFAANVCSLFDIDARFLIWIEQTSQGDKEDDTYARVDFDRAMTITPMGKIPEFRQPRRSILTHADVEEIKRGLGYAET
jgi:hypothetical protein